ncbi:DUF6387 family protein [Enterobacter bugandensis]|uniref:DUF6387 family protein n=1 Tax=Enterobacter bugandensis TaxID=881260 RepID=UPI0021D3E6FD|nr:DUF6387 family protein [Enterobacter bugandensis]MCU6216489.1 hypothetical protein [Enterobacter bugandensis]
MKIIRDVRELPKSFMLSKYEDLDNLTDKDFFRQLYWRREFDFINYNENQEYGFCHGAHLPISHHDDPFMEIASIIHKSNDEKPDLITMSSSSNIYPITRYDVSSICFAEAEHGYGKGRKIIFSHAYNGDESLSWPLMAEPVNMLTRTYGESMLLRVELNQSDEKLIQEFSLLLKKWRNELNVYHQQEDDSSSNTDMQWSIVRKRIQDYRIIPFLDLLHWQEATEAYISDKLLTIILYPYGEKGEIQFSQTVKKFLRKVTSHLNLNKFIKELLEE